MTSLLPASLRRTARCFLSPPTLVRGVVWILLMMSAGVSAAFCATRTVPTDRPVNYEAFGAVGDGVADDLPAIVEAHAFANAHGLVVKTKGPTPQRIGPQWQLRAGAHAP